VRKETTSAGNVRFVVESTAVNHADDLGAIPGAARRKKARDGRDPPPAHDRDSISGITITIGDGFVQAPSPMLTAKLDTIAATLPVKQDEDDNIAQGIPDNIGLVKSWSQF
jgi:hypothetical protein